MSPSGHKKAAPKARSHAPVFAALGDETRLALLAKLSRGRHCSISELAQGSSLTRQAITKHLRVLEKAGMVRCTRSGRERLFALDPQPVVELKAYLDVISQRWEGALRRLKSYVEDETVK